MADDTQTEVSDETMDGEDGDMTDEDTEDMDDESMDGEDTDETMDETDMQDEGVSVDTSSDSSVGVYAPYTEDAIARASGKVVLAFFAEWCPTCNAADKALKEDGSEIPAGVTILKVNYDDAAALKEKYSVTAQHTFIQIDSAGELLKKWRGGERVSEIIAQVQ